MTTTTLDEAAEAWANPEYREGPVHIEAGGPVAWLRKVSLGDVKTTGCRLNRAADRDYEAPPPAFRLAWSTLRNAENMFVDIWRNTYDEPGEQRTPVELLSVLSQEVVDTGLTDRATIHVLRRELPCIPQDWPKLTLGLHVKGYASYLSCGRNFYATSGAKLERLIPFAGYTSLDTMSLETWSRVTQIAFGQGL